jgi:hypothetical protein
MKWLRHEAAFQLRTPIVTVCLLTLSLLPLHAQQAMRTPARVPVIVELFTSEGCSSCPPADALLARLDHDQPVPGADIIVLGEHVDYWDSLGWRDRFSSHQFTERQNGYAQRFRLDDPYTPQMVVDGANQFVGSDSAHILHGIGEAARGPKLALALSTLTFDGPHLSGSVSLAPSANRPAAADGKAEVFAVLVESTASTQVRGGENGGRTLHHASPVRVMQRIGSLDALEHSPLPFTLPFPADTTSGNVRVIVFVQRPGQGAMLGAVSLRLAPDFVGSASVDAAHWTPLKK